MRLSSNLTIKIQLFIKLFNTSHPKSLIFNPSPLGQKISPNNPFFLLKTTKTHKNTP